MGVKAVRKYVGEIDGRCRVFSWVTKEEEFQEKLSFFRSKTNSEFAQEYQTGIVTFF